MKIAIFGLARSGISVYKYLKAQKDVEIYLVNQGEPKTWPSFDLIQEHKMNAYDQVNAEEILCHVDQIILSPGIPREHLSLVKALSLGVSVISEIEFAFNHSDIPVIGITGTNGKTTTTTMIGEVLQSFGKKVFVCGNIGRPYSDLLLEKEDYDFAVVELSSFQLESIENFHPFISLILNITENHTERYKKFLDYKKAKAQITKNQVASDYLITNEEIKSLAKKIKIKDLENFDFTKSKLIGEHNKKNFFCAYKVCELLKLDRLDSIFQSFINSFSGVEYRLQYIGETSQLKFYNDAKSTNDEATIAAINAFKDEHNLHLIIGGKLRSEVIHLHEKLDHLNLKTIYVFGEAKDLLENKIKDKNILKFDTIEEVLLDIKKRSLSGSILFSPAFPSFDQYKDYTERGKDFTNKVTELFL